MATRAAISLVTITTPSLTIGGLTGARVSRGLQSLIRRAGGFPDPQGAWTQKGRPAFSVTTLTLSALSSIGIEGAECTTVATFWHKKKAYGSRETGANHVKLTLAKAYAVPRSLRFAKGENVELAVDFLGVSSDGETNPLARTDSQALPAGYGITEAYAPAHLDIGGSDFDVSDGTLEFGVDARTDGMRAYDEEAWIENRDPALNVNSPDIAAEAAAASGAGHIYFRKRQNGTVFYPDNASQHLKISWAASRVDVGDSGGDEEVVVPLTIWPLWNGTDPVLTIATGQAIT